MAREISQREIEACGKTLLINQNLGNEHGASVWDAAIVLAKYIENSKKFQNGFWKGKSILELGSGNGYLGIVLGLLGAKVIMTDLAILLPLIEENVKLNHLEHMLNKQLLVQELLWGRDIPTEKYDYIIASDCIYDNEEMWTDFAIALKQLATRSTKIIISYEYRSEVDKKFFSFIKQDFEINKVDSDDLDPDWQSDDIAIFYLTRNE
jgi:predicted nicotinamide N-methyase